MSKSTSNLENALESNAYYYKEAERKLYKEYLTPIVDLLNYQYIMENGLNELTVNNYVTDYPSICDKDRVIVMVNDDSKVKASEAKLAKIVGNDWQNIEDMIEKLENYNY